MVAVKEEAVTAEDKALAKEESKPSDNWTLTWWNQVSCSMERLVPLLGTLSLETCRQHGFMMDVIYKLYLECWDWCLLRNHFNASSNLELVKFINEYWHQKYQRRIGWMNIGTIVKPKQRSNWAYLSSVWCSCSFNSQYGSYNVVYQLIIGLLFILSLSCTWSDCDFVSLHVFKLILCILKGKMSNSVN